MSSEYDFIVLLLDIQTNLYKFGGPILMSLGTASCILSLIIYTKKNLRKNPCSIYFVVVTVANFLIIYTSILLATLQTGYNINPSSYNLGFCHVRFYLIILLDILSPSYLISASVDRTLLTSRNALTRRRSTSRLAYICIMTITLFWLLSSSHALVFTNISQFAPDYYVCYFQSGIYLAFIGYFSIIIKGILFPLLMLVFGLWTVKNIRNVGRVAPAPDVKSIRGIVHDGLGSAHSKDHQLIKILLIDISVYLIFSLLILVVLMYQQITQYQSKSLVQDVTEVFLVNIGTFIAYIPSCIGCYTNLLVSKTFRREVKNFLMCK